MRINTQFLVNALPGEGETISMLSVMRSASFETCVGVAENEWLDWKTDSDFFFLLKYRNGVWLGREKKYN